jgi:dipicolinate synthase subunit A
VKNVLIIGGDMRQFYLAEKIKNNFPNTEVCFENCSKTEFDEKIKSSDVLVCPVPFSKDGKNIFSNQNKLNLDIHDFLTLISSKHTVWGGNIPKNIKSELKERGIDCFDFMEFEEVSIKNAIATAEGAIAEAIGLSSINLHKSKCLVLGYGRCGKVLAQKLKALDSRVTVAGRNKESLAYGFSLGLETADINYLESIVSGFDFIFNTVPAEIINKNVIDLIKKDAVIIDIASAPGGTDFDYCKKSGITAKLCLGLPGKFSPKTSADILFDVIVKFL